ncbi:hypothetical protein T4E_10724 [Trichinella pseudospiralis]|uniref:Uncharacterized protein n=1 Tax=Trichinella pseudospiralis TaxID=6337 RepID=A0A0V0YFQ4_TRIPS|nr:hypothetical protein T4E_10724 [Trichinella pseudospiralis]
MNKLYNLKYCFGFLLKETSKVEEVEKNVSRNDESSTTTRASNYLLLQEQHRILGCSISAPALICTGGAAVAARRPRIPLDIAKSFASGSARRSQNACTVNFSLPNR